KNYHIPPYPFISSSPYSHTHAYTPTNIAYGGHSVLGSTPANIAHGGHPALGTATSNTSASPPTNAFAYPPTSHSPYQPASISSYTYLYRPTNTAYRGHSVLGSTPANIAHGGHPALGTATSNTSAYPPTNAIAYPPTSKTSYQPASVSSYTPPKNPPIEPRRFSWDDKADVFALAGHRAGKTVYEIGRQLFLRGYDAPVHLVSESLYRQGVEVLKIGAPWDSRADTFALAAHSHGQTPSQIAAQLCKNGYEAAGAMVVASLNRQRISAQLELPGVTAPNHEASGGKQMSNKAKPNKVKPKQPLPWDSNTDAFALNANAQGQTVPQITAQLCRNGYGATITQVVASLNRQGANL
ncbi:hypothetical protein MMC31_001111, partial [Peltigera leucophlebia]|nr:hypothetical protein [Peltigera leucophlebia]